MGKLNRRDVIKGLGMAAASLAAAQRGLQARAAPSRIVWSPYVVFLNANAKAFIVDTHRPGGGQPGHRSRGYFGQHDPGRQEGVRERGGEGETRVVILDLENLRVAKVLETGNRPKHGLVSPDGRRVGVDHWALSGVSFA